MAGFDKAYLKTNAHEGGYVNDPTDKGGETIDGISRVHHPNWQGWVIVDRVKREHGRDAKTINRVLAKDSIFQQLKKLFYKAQYWDVNSLDMIPHQRIAEEMYDTGVNMGVKVAAMFLQEALNLCNNAGKLYANILVDGDVGPITRGALAKSDADRVFKTMNLLQGERYINILRRNESQEKFWGGWMERVIC